MGDIDQITVGVSTSHAMLHPGKDFLGAEASLNRVGGIVIAGGVTPVQLLHIS